MEDRSPRWGLILGQYLNISHCVRRVDTLRTTPIALSHVERTPDNLRVDIPLLIDKRLLYLDDRRLSLIVHAQDTTTDLELLPGATRREWLVEGDLAFAVDHASRVKVGNTWNGMSALRGVEIDYFLGGAFECYSKLAIVLGRAIGRRVGEVRRTVT